MLIFVGVYYFTFNFSLLAVKGKIKRREREINKEVAFIGQYLLVKLYSGKPILNSLTETSQSRGVLAKYIKEIVDDIDTGNPVEIAIENAITYSPSIKFRKILFQINNALKLGIDVTKPLESVIKDITDEQEIEIKRYGRKLNSIVIFYMLMGVVLPSIGMVMLIVLSSFINFPIGTNEFIIVIFFLGVVQLTFISVFKSIRPQVNL